MSVVFSEPSGPLVILGLPNFSFMQIGSLTETIFEALLAGRLFPRPSAPIATAVFPGKGTTSAFFELFSMTPIVFATPLSSILHISKAKVGGFPSECFPIGSFLFFVAYSNIPTTAVSPPDSPTPNPVSVEWSTYVVISSSYSAAVDIFPESHVFFVSSVGQLLSH